MICNLLEYEYAWAWLRTEGMLRKAYLLLDVYVEIIDVPLDLGEYLRSTLNF